ncbi:hypothetical protein [Zooshikella ganghwensis]|uniref:hypothetical protein n=1 Tax=Zooshikella ganghwensis TaxID=202772 RepID=UPI000420C501|nr:hypothetical protein [Zooshikella ganghwensis]
MKKISLILIVLALVGCQGNVKRQAFDSNSVNNSLLEEECFKLSRVAYIFSYEKEKGMSKEDILVQLSTKTRNYKFTREVMSELFDSNKESVDPDSYAKHYYTRCLAKNNIQLKQANRLSGCTALTGDVDLIIFLKKKNRTQQATIESYTSILTKYGNENLIPLYKAMINKIYSIDNKYLSKYPHYAFHQCLSYKRQ